MRFEEVLINRTFVAIAPVLLLVALPARAGIGDKALPLLSGQKTKLYYTLNGVSDTAQIATVIYCTNTAPSGGNAVRVGIEVFGFSGTQLNNTGVGQGTANVLLGRTLTFVTKATAAFPEDKLILPSGAAATHGASARIFATGKTFVCSALLVDKTGNPPDSMTTLPIFSTLKQSGQ